VLLESFHPGLDLRILVIGYEVVAAAIRHPAEVVGDGQHSMRALIEAQSRRRQAATGGESRIPLDDETERTLQAAGVGYDEYCRPASAWPCGAPPTCTPAAPGRRHRRLHPVLADAAVRAARALEIPVVGLD
jgi:hypothetical protein